MIALVLLVVVAVLVTAVASQRRGTSGSPAPSPTPLADDRLRLAVDAGIISQEQADRVAALAPVAVATAPAPPRPAGSVSTATEVLGYLGAVLAMAGVTTLVAQFWDDLTSWSRLALLGAAAVAFLVAGLSVRGEEVDDAAMRLRSFLLLLSTAATAGFAGLLSADVLDWSPEATTRLVGGTVAVQSALLWARRATRPAQHLTTFGGLVALVAATFAELASPGVVGIVLWALAAGWLAAGWHGWLLPSEVAQVLGGATMLVSCIVMAGSWEDVTPVAGLATAAGLLAAGSRGHRPVVSGLGVLGVLVFLPATIITFFGDTVGVPVAFLLVGGLLLALAVRHLRHPGAGIPPALTS